MKRATILGLVGLVAAFAVGLGACGSSGDVGSGGTCFRATDCAEGLYCFGVTATKGGTCTSNVDKAQPPAGDANFPDGGQVMGQDGPTLDVPNVPDAPNDMGSPPGDTGGGGMDTGGPMDTGAPPKDSGKSKG